MSILRSSIISRAFHTSRPTSNKVAIIGAAGGIGQPLALLLKQNTLVKSLRLYDLNAVTPGVGADLSHINTPAVVESYTGDQMSAAIKDADIIVVPAGVPRKPGMTRDDLFAVNANIVAQIAETAATAAPNAALLIISNPVNSTVPICAEVLKRKNVYNKNKLFGVTTLDVVRANTFLAAHLKTDVNKVNVPVIGGHAGITILPLLSQVKVGGKAVELSQQDKEALTQRIMFGGDEVVKAKGGAGSATLSMAFAGARFTDSLLRAYNGEKGVIECSYVDQSDQNLASGLKFFSSPIELGKDGIAKIHSFGTLDAFEQKKHEELIPELKGSIQKGVDFVKQRQ
jgi:malate dehydrogenase